MSRERASKGNHYYRQLRRNIIMAIVIVSLVPLLLAQGVMLLHFRGAYREKVMAHLHELVLKHRQSVDLFLTDRLANIRVLSRAYDPAILADKEFLGRQLSLLREEFGGVFVDLGLVDSEGKQLAYAGPHNLAGVDYSQAAWFKLAMAHDQFISDVFTGLRGTPHFIVAVKQESHGQEWILRATIDIEAFNSLVENIRLGKTGFAFIVNRQGELQTRPRFAVDVARPPYAEFLRAQTLPGKVTVIQALGQDDQKYIIAASLLKGGQWILFYQQEYSDALSELIGAEILGLLMVAAGVVAVLIMAIAVSGRMTKRIAKADEQKQLMDDKMLEAGRLASIGELAAGIAHEINNPVAIMVEEAGWLEDLLEDDDPFAAANREEFERALAQIKTQGARCKGITHKLLSFARKTDPEARDISVNEMIQEAISLLGQKSRYANVKIQARLRPGLPPVKASPSELQQVLVNLINNAVDAIDSSGGMVTVTSEIDQGNVVLRVSDTGKGIPAANLARIFDPFFTTKPVGQGTGLGLSICYGIVHKIGGEIGVESQLGQGTTFTITLPASLTREERA